MGFRYIVVYCYNLLLGLPPLVKLCAEVPLSELGDPLEREPFLNSVDGLVGVQVYTKIRRDVHILLYLNQAEQSVA